MRSASPLLIATCVLLAAACNAKDKSAASGGAVAAAAAPAVVTVHAKDFAFEAPAEITAGVTTFHLVNDGPGFHHMQIVRLDSAKTVADLEAALKQKGPPPAWAAFITGPNAPMPGNESNATFDIAAGNYAVICLVDMPGGVPHFAKGMIKALTVKPAAAGAAVAALPTADITLTLQNYSFMLSTPITSGKHVFAVKTQPGQPHEVEIFKLAAGKTKDDLFKWMNGKMDSPPPLEAVLAGVAATTNGVDARFTADFTPGDYLLVCFLPDATDGKPHFMKGMVQPIKVS
jgi:hypothetical protein